MYLSEYPDTNVLVVGHTDSVGSEEMNMTLSKNRAQAVTNYFVQNKGLAHRDLQQIGLEKQLQSQTIQLLQVALKTEG